MGAENSNQTDKPRFVGEWVRLGELVSIKTGKLDANAADEDGIYPFFTCAENTLRINTAAYDCECVLVAGNGDLNVKYYNGKFNAYQRTYIIEVLDRRVLDPFYLYQFLKSYVQTLREQSIGGVIKYIKLCNLKDALIPLPDVQIQQNIVGEFEKMDLVLEKQSDLSSHLDALVKSRFVEMFGSRDVGYKYPSKPLGELATFKSGASLPKDREQSSGDVIYAKVGDLNLTENSLAIVTSRVFVDAKTAGKHIIPEGAVVFPKRGGAIATNKKRITVQECCLDLNLMSVIPGKKLGTRYLLAWFDSFDLADIANGSAVPQINNKDLNPLQIPLPPLSLQQEFATCVAQVDKLRFAIQEQIKKLETLKASLMQEYFG